MKKVLLTGIIALTAFTAYSQNEKLLTFDEAVNITLANNPAMTAAAYEEEAALRERRAAVGLRMPQIGVTGAYAFLSQDIEIDLNSAKAPIASVIGGLGELLPPPVLEQAQGLLKRDWALKLQDRSFGNVSTMATIPLYTGGKINAANNAAKINMKSVEQKSYQSANALITELTERYYGLSLALQVLKVREQVLKGMEQHLADAVALEKNGVIARAERLYAEVAVADAQREYYKAGKLVETLRSALSNTLNSPGEYLPVSNMFILSGIEDAEYYKQMAVENNPLLKQVSLKRDLAVENVRLKRSEFAPQVAVMGAYSIYNYQVSHLMPRWAIGAGVSFKIFDGVSREHKYGAARSQVKQVEALSIKANNDIITLIEKLYNEMGVSKDQIPSYDKSEEFADEYLRIKNEAFKEGAATSLDVVDAQLNLAKIKTGRLQAAYYYDMMLASLLEACGSSETLPQYGKRSDAQPIIYNNK